MEQKSKNHSEQLLDEIKSELEQKSIHEEVVPFREKAEESLFVMPMAYDDEVLKNEIVNAMALWDTSVEPLTNANGIKGKIKTLLNKAARVSMNSHMTSQNAFNVSVVNALLQLEQLAKENQELQNRVKTLEHEIEKLKREL